MMPDKDLTDDVLDEIIAGAKTAMEQYLALSLKAERAAKQKADGNSPVIPDGWVMVPAEPTDEMLNALYCLGTRLVRKYEVELYGDMLAVAPDFRERSGSSTVTQCSACGRLRDAGDIVHLPSCRLCSDCIATASDVVAERRDLHVRCEFDKRKQEVREEMELGARVTKNRFRL